MQHRKSGVKLRMMPNCERCGTSVAKGVKFCNGCKPLATSGAAPAAHWNLEPQKPPAYAPQSRTVDDDAV